MTYASFPDITELITVVKSFMAQAVGVGKHRDKFSIIQASINEELRQVFAKKPL